MQSTIIDVNYLGLGHIGRLLKGNFPVKNTKLLNFQEPRAWTSPLLKPREMFYSCFSHYKEPSFTHVYIVFCSATMLIVWAQHFLEDEDGLPRDGVWSIWQIPIQKKKRNRDRVFFQA